MKSLILEPKSSLVELLKNFLRTIVLFIVEIKVQKLILLKYTQDEGIWGGNSASVQSCFEEFFSIFSLERFFRKYRRENPKS